MGDSPRFAVRFDAEAFAEDLAHASAAGRALAQRERERLQRDGIDGAHLLRCEAEGRDGTRLGGCVKTYTPWPGGRWGMVFRGWRDDERRALLCLAFGVRHPRSAWQPSVYVVADRRLHGPPGL